MKIDERRWTVKVGDDTASRIPQDEMHQLLVRHREKNRQDFAGSEARLLRWLQEKKKENYVSSVFTTTEGQFIFRTVWRRDGGGHLHTDVMTPEECPHPSLVELARRRRGTVLN